ncbi:MAG: hypothetical protein LBD41_06775, partial [Clostridiales Family XIII bacterium]|nr:hypothetical protein [Clostridiales Family XIII bacterium]
LINRVNKIKSWTKENPTVKEIARRLGKLDIEYNKILSIASELKSTYFNYATWTDSDLLNISIGQGENAYTPIQMANYTATMGNSGKRYEASILKAKSSTGEIKRKLAKNIKISQDKIDAVLEGMRRVVSNGTLNGTLGGMPYSISGKTGTAEIGSYQNPKSEVEYIKEHLSSINPKLSFKKVKKEMNRLLKKYPKIYTSEDTAVRVAVKNLSGEKFNMAKLDAYKSSYDPFGWVISLTPTKKPEIAVAGLIVQANSSSPPGSVIRDIIGEYFALKEKDEKEGKTKVDYKELIEKKEKK